MKSLECDYSHTGADRGKINNRRWLKIEGYRLTLDLTPDGLESTVLGKSKTSLRTS